MTAAAAAVSAAAVSGAAASMPAAAAAAAVPLVDLSLGEEAAAAALRAACESAGFFYLAGSGVDEALVARYQAANRALFALPAAAKRALRAGADGRGWTPLGEETLDPAASAAGDAHEGFYFGREVAPGAPEAALPLHGPNRWPPEAALPGYRSAAEAYLAAMEALGARMTRVVARSLGLPADHFAPSFRRPMVFLRPLRYAAERSAEAAGRHAAGAHTDYGFLTFLRADGERGLEIDAGGGVWAEVPPRASCFTVNVGDMLERWTDGRYRSTRHRVVNAAGRERFSTICFFEPDFDAAVAALPACLALGAAPRWPPTTAGAHLLERYAATRAGWAGEGAA
jgi:isopenicillin N synthase-like dioxygenase